MRLRLRLRPFVAAAALMAAACTARASEVPAGFNTEVLATGLNAATAIALTPDGRILIADQTGPLRVWKDGTLLPTPALDLSERLDTWWERGLIGVTLHPDFPRTPHVFVLYVAKAPYTHHVLSRFTLRGDVIDPASEHILLEGEDQKQFGGQQPAGHQGGPLCFGPDGKLYVALGEQTSGKPAQSLAHLQGKILRLNLDGTAPADNPFYAETTGKFRAIWARGLRNPFGLAFQPETGRLFATDVGQTAWEEVDEIKRGANYGWPDAEGMADNPAFTNPLHTYPPAIGRCIVGGTFSPRAASGKFPLPAAWRGKFFFGDWAANWIKALDPENPGDVVTFARGLSGPVALEFAPDGSLLVLNRSTIWRDGKKWQTSTGSLLRIRYTGEKSDAPPAPVHATTLGATGLFKRNLPLTPTGGQFEFTLAAPPWLPGVTARRWISVPVGARLRINADGEFEFPRGTIISQHFTVTKTGAPLETQILSFDGAAAHSRLARAAAYRWTDAKADATLVTETALASLPGDAACRWISPAAERELNLDTSVAGFLLPLSPRQLDARQAALWVKRGWLAADAIAPGTPRLVPLNDATAPLAQRVRSYLDANCATCHRPGGLSRAQFDLRWATPLEQSGIFKAEPIGGDLGIVGARVVLPGSPEKSLLYRRLVDTGPFRMPPLGLHDEPSPVVPLIQEWIKSLK